LTQRPCAPLRDCRRAQTPHYPEEKNTHQRDVREVYANAHGCAACKTTPKCIITVFAYSPLFSRHKFPSYTIKKNAAQKTFLAVNLAFFFGQNRTFSDNDFFSGNIWL
jgi:hypothetical protein